MDINEAWRQKSFNVIGWGLVVLVYFLLIAIVFISIVFCNRKVQENAKKSAEVCHPEYFSLFSFR
ncbi:hypothetical protein [Guptibacillus spartinae]|uniref:hypothetical protein n=1 Tax=Guptibacillus spartinae TaxID=3025679 RepID=UPI00235FD063|nr:hypothetical protein [Pseudalkalibacillus spartinae]